MAYWKDNADSWKCSACGYESGGNCPICPNCGATMNNVAVPHKRKEKGLTTREKAKRYDALMVGIKAKIKNIEGISKYNCPDKPTIIQAFDYGRSVQARQDILTMRKWVKE